MKKFIYFIMILLLGLSCLGIAACDGGDDEGDEATSEATAEATSEETSEATEEPTSQPTVGDGACEDIPAYPGADEAEQAQWSWGGNSSAGYESVEWRYYTTNDGVDEVISFYEDEMANEGWENVMSMDMDEWAMAAWAREDGDIGAGISAGTDDGETGIMIWCGYSADNGMFTGEPTGLPTSLPTSLPTGLPTDIPTGIPTPPTEMPESVDPVQFSDLIAVLPDAPSGWTGDEPNGGTFEFGEWSWSEADRDYWNDDTGEYASVGIYDSAYYYGFGWFALWDMQFEYETSDGYARTTTVAGYEAFETYDAPDSYSLMVFVADRFMVFIDAETEESLDLFSDEINYEELEQLA